jgi:membrane associated rhomboid family serine protease
MMPWTKRLLIANGVIFLVLFMMGGAGQRVAAVLAVNSHMWWTSPPYFPVWQILTYGFVHDLTGFSHILFNSLTLFFFGSMLERALGSRKMLTVYFGSLLFGGVLHAVLGVLPGMGGIMLGASGAIMGVLVAAAMLFPRVPILLLFIPVPLYVGAILLVVIDLLGFTRAGGGVAHDVHLAGALFGFLYIKLGWYQRADPAIFDLRETLAARKATKTAQTQAQDEARLDELLARINRDGMSSLSSAEKEFLKRMSKRP